MKKLTTKQNIEATKQNIEAMGHVVLDVYKVDAQTASEICGAPRTRGGWVVEHSETDTLVSIKEEAQEEQAAPTLTRNEEWVCEALMDSEYEIGVHYVQYIAEYAGISECSIGGVIASLVKKGVVSTDGDVIQLTELGMSLQIEQPSEDDLDAVEMDDAAIEVQEVVKESKLKAPKKKNAHPLLRDDETGEEARNAFCEKYPWVEPNSFAAGGKGVQCICICQDTGERMLRNTQDVFQSQYSLAAKKERRKAKRKAQREAKKAAQGNDE